MRIVAESVINGQQYETNVELNVVIRAQDLEKYRAIREKYYQEKHNNEKIRVAFKIAEYQTGTKTAIQKQRRKEKRNERLGQIDRPSDATVSRRNARYI